MAAFVKDSGSWKEVMNISSPTIFKKASGSWNNLWLKDGWVKVNGTWQPFWESGDVTVDFYADVNRRFRVINSGDGDDGEDPIILSGNSTKNILGMWSDSGVGTGSHYGIAYTFFSSRTGVDIQVFLNEYPYVLDVQWQAVTQFNQFNDHARRYNISSNPYPSSNPSGVGNLQLTKYDGIVSQIGSDDEAGFIGKLDPSPSAEKAIASNRANFKTLTIADGDFTDRQDFVEHCASQKAVILTASDGSSGIDDASDLMDHNIRDETSYALLRSYELVLGGVDYGPKLTITFSKSPIS